VSQPIKQLSQFSRSNQDLLAARRKIQELQERIKRMEEAGDKMANLLLWQSRIDRKTSPSASAWRKAKEDKP